jgi:hypothetical protein
MDGVAEVSQLVLRERQSRVRGLSAELVACFHEDATVETSWMRGRPWRGTDDELGTLNLITDQVRARAVAEARTGRTVSLARQVRATPLLAGGAGVPLSERANPAGASRGKPAGDLLTPCSRHP